MARPQYEVKHVNYRSTPSAEQLEKLEQAQQQFEKEMTEKAQVKQNEQEALEKEFFGFEVVEQEVTFESAMEELNCNMEFDK